MSTLMGNFEDDDEEAMIGRICSGCCQRYDDSEEFAPHAVECFESTGKFLCQSCWEEYCEDALIEEGTVAIMAGGEG